MENVLKIEFLRYPGINIEFLLNDLNCCVGKVSDDVYLIYLNFDNQVVTENTFKIIFSGKRQLIDQGHDHADILCQIKKISMDTFDLFPYLQQIRSSFSHNFNGFENDTSDAGILDQIIGFDGTLSFKLILPPVAWVSILKLGLTV